jgi:hypothetical protein
MILQRLAPALLLLGSSVFAQPQHDAMVKAH